MRKYLQIHNPSPDDVTVRSFETEKHGTKWSVRLGPADDSVTFYGSREELVTTFEKVMKGLGYGTFASPFSDLSRVAGLAGHFDRTVTDNMTGEITMYPALTETASPKIEEGDTIQFNGVPIVVDKVTVHPDGGRTFRGRVAEPEHADPDAAMVSPLDFEEARRARRKALGLPELGEEWNGDESS
jgi:hypothetical protein